jgi:hypothetical protein
MSALPDPAAALVAFVLGCLLIHAARAHARATTVLLAATALVLCATVGGVLCDRLGLPSGSAEAGVLFWPHPGR